MDKPRQTVVDPAARRGAPLVVDACHTLVARLAGQGPGRRSVGVRRSQ